MVKIENLDLENLEVLSRSVDNALMRCLTKTDKRALKRHVKRALSVLTEGADREVFVQKLRALRSKRLRTFFRIVSEAFVDRHFTGEL